MDRELDKFIAEKVMGLEVVVTEYNKKRGTPHTVYSIGYPYYFDIQGAMELANPLHNYSGDIYSAFEVVQKINSMSEATEFTLYKDYEGLYHCTFKLHGSRIGEGIEHNADTPTEAICLAAKKLVEHEYE